MVIVEYERVKEIQGRMNPINPDGGTSDER
jgi:hypothetical protein